MMKPIFRGIAGLALAVLVSPAVADEPKIVDAPFDDQAFVRKAASGGLHEVELGKLARNQGENPDVKEFAARMVVDHSKANAKLASLAKAEGFELVAQMNDEDRAEFDKFKSLRGAEFDRAYIKHMLEAHEKDAVGFTRASRTAKNPKLKDFSAEMLPVIQEHLDLIKKLRDKLKY